MGLAIALVIALVTGGALWRLGGLRGRMGAALVATLLIGVAGYLWQGRPGLDGKPTPPPPDMRQPDSAFARERTRLLERFGSDAQVLDAADALHRSGYDAYAVGLIKGALEKNPQSAQLWVGLGNALSLYAGGMVTPPAEFAFDRAAALAPDNPAPRYFRGLAYLQAGQPERTVEIWTDLVATAPADAPWRADIAFRLMKLQQMMEAASAAPARR